MTQRAQHTPGPWQWFGNGYCEEIYLATVNNGRVYVMGFGKPPRFQVDHRMVSAMKLAKFEVGNPKVTGVRQARKSKSVYRQHICGIDHPDAHLIAAAPEMYEALDDCIAMFDGGVPECEWDRIKQNARRTLAKARGES